MTNLKNKFPPCVDCGKRVSSKNTIRCRKCSDKNRIGKRNSKIEIVCQNCGNKFLIYPSRKGIAKYCSQKCYSKKFKRICQECGKEFSIYSNRKNTAKFCSRKCFGKWNSKYKIGNTHPRWKNITITCKQCGKVFHSSHSKTQYCSSKCYWESIIGEDSPNWQGGKSFELYPPSFNRQLKDRIRVRDNFICQLCGVPELECDRNLDIHHIDYNKKNCEESNLTTLCRSCNTKVNTNREHWANYFQKEIKVEFRASGKQSDFQ